MSESITDITLNEVSPEHSPQRALLRFSPRIENIYRSESVDEQYKSVAFGWLIGTILYSLFFLSDYIVCKDNIRLYLIGRILINLPLCLAITYFISRKTRFHQVLICAVPLVMTVTLSVLLIFSHGDYRGNYLFGDILLMMCGCIISRPRIAYTIGLVVIQCVCYHIVLQTTDIVSPANKVVNSLFCLSGGIVTIMTSYAIDQISRRAFLLSLRVRLLNRELEGMAMTDPLTGLGNRRSFEDVTRRFWLQASGAHADAMASFILIDVDRFKSFNDNYGHSAGDLCLTTIGRCVKAEMREEQHVAVRFGGEELIIFLPDTDFNKAQLTAERIRRAICDAAIPHPVLAPEAVVTASLGVATAPIRDCTSAELVIRADTALYAAKHNGRNQVWPPLTADPSALSARPVSMTG